MSPILRGLFHPFPAKAIDECIKPTQFSSCCSVSFAIASPECLLRLVEAIATNSFHRLGQKPCASPNTKADNKSHQLRYDEFFSHQVFARLACNEDKPHHACNNHCPFENDAINLPSFHFFPPRLPYAKHCAVAF